ncbi:MAG: IS110 family transposase [Kangiellaceae bacterium]|nr:IS110 family transposase [Kangiellaceae bacterium]
MNHITKLLEKVNAKSFKDIQTRNYPAYVGMDTHKDTIVVSIAIPGRTKPKHLGTIANDPKKIAILVKNISKKHNDEVVLFCYEAGPCGYVLYHQITSLGHDCMVVAPSLIPQKSSKRVKTDRIDAQKLARYLRDGSLTSVWVPNTEQEAMRDLVRIRLDFKIQETKAKQQINGFILRNGHIWPKEKSRWTKEFYTWLEELKFKHPWQQVVLQEYFDALIAATNKLNQLCIYIGQVRMTWSQSVVIDSMRALRGIDTLAAMTILAEVGDFTRFDHPKKLMSYLGLTPSEYSSSTKRRQGSITKAGNSSARRMLIESAWSYKFPARKTKHIKAKEKNASDHAKEVAWKAQKRLCTRYQTLIGSGKNKNQIIVAIARELVGFIWEIVVVETHKLKQAQLLK